MPYYNRDPKKDHNFDNHPNMHSQDARSAGSNIAIPALEGVEAGSELACKDHTNKSPRVLLGSVRFNQ